MKTGNIGKVKITKVKDSINELIVVINNQDNNTSIKLDAKIGNLSKKELGWDRIQKQINENIKTLNQFTSFEVENSYKNLSLNDLIDKIKEAYEGK